MPVVRVYPFIGIPAAKEPYQPKERLMSEPFFVVLKTKTFIRQFYNSSHH